MKSPSDQSDQIARRRLSWERSHLGQIYPNQNEELVNIQLAITEIENELLNSELQPPAGINGSIRVTKHKKQNLSFPSNLDKKQNIIIKGVSQ